MKGKQETITIGKFYSYVVDGIKINTKMLEAVKQTKIEGIQKEFSTILHNQKLSSQFRSTLRELNAHDLEDILYGNHSDVTEASSVIYTFPDEEFVKNQFQRLNGEYQYFSGEDEEAISQFMKVFKACKLMADYIECNNNLDNEVAFLHAYKILVLFGLPQKNSNPLSGIEKYIGEYYSAIASPVHDALVLPLSVNNPPLQDMIGWRTFIKSGAKTMEFFQIASSLEQNNNGKAPEKILDAQKIASRLTYHRYEEYPELAVLCKKYKVSEGIFNQCLEIEKRRKTSDNLPNVKLDGNEVGHPGYYLVKLPIDDPRAYILGHITNCCQSIGGHSEQCVIDGITRANNGFYVLLKGKKHNVTLTDNNQINPDDFDIAGQGYAWLSKEQCLVFDSWENLRETENPVITVMLPEFGKRIVDKHPDIFRVTVGTGGKTPKQLKSNRTITSETIAEGFQYGDSNKQSLIYCNEELNAGQIEYLNKQWDVLQGKPLGLGWTEFSKVIPLCEINLSRRAALIKRLFLQETLNEQFWAPFRSELANNLENRLQFTPVLLDLLNTLYQNNLLQTEYITDIQRICALEQSTINDICRGLAILTNAGFVTKETIQTIITKSDGAIRSISLAISKLEESRLLTEEMFQIIAGKNNFALGTAQAFIILKDCKTLKEEVFNIIVTLEKDMVSVANVIALIEESGSLTHEMLQIITRNSKYASSVFQVLFVLKDSGFLNGEMAKGVYDNAQYVTSIVQILALLKDSGFLTEGIIQTILANANYAAYVYRTLKLINKSGALTEDIVLKFIAECQYAEYVVNALEMINKSRLLTKEAIQIIIEKHQYAKNVANALDSFIGHELLKKEYTQIILAKIEYAEVMANALITLKKSDLMSDDIIGIVIEQDQYAAVLADAVANLYEADLLREGIVRVLIAKNRYAAVIARALRVLKNVEQLTEELFQIIIEQEQHALSVAQCIYYLTEANQLTEENLNLVIRNAQYSDTVQEAFFRLTNQNIVLSDLICTTILSNSESAVEMSRGIGALKSKRLLTRENCQVISEHPKHAVAMAEALGILNSEYQLTPENIQVLCSNPLYAKNIAKAWGILNSAGLITPENSDAIVSNARYATEIALAWRDLYTANLLTVENQECILLNAEHGNKITKAFIWLDKDDLLTPEFRKLILAQADAADVVQYLAPEILTYDNCQALFSMPKYANNLANAFNLLNEANLLSAESRDALLMQAKHSSQIAAALSSLKKHYLLTKEGFETVLTNAEHARKFDRSLTFINKHLGEEKLKQFHVSSSIVKVADFFDKIDDSLKSRKATETPATHTRRRLGVPHGKSTLRTGRLTAPRRHSLFATPAAPAELVEPQNPIVRDIENQISILFESEYFNQKTGRFDQASCYPQKWVVLESLKYCVTHKFTRDDLQFILELNSGYDADKGEENAVEIGKLVERVLLECMSEQDTSRFTPR